MPDLPKISEEFSADPSGYVAALQAMIDKTNELIGKVAELKDLIDDISGKNIEINVIGDAQEVIAQIKEDIDALDGKEIVVNVVYKEVGRPETVATVAQVTEQVATPGGNIQALREQAAEFNDVADAAQNANEKLAELKNTQAEVNDATILAVSADEVMSRALDDESLGATKLATILGKVAFAKQEARIESDNAVAAAAAAAKAADAEAASMQRLEESLKNTDSAFDELSTRAGFLRNAIAQNIDYTNLLADAEKALALQIAPNLDLVNLLAAKLAAGGGDAEAFRASVAGGVPTMLAFALGAQKAGDNVGGMMIPISAATFGITGIGTAIHLAVMGTFEFLAVFLPAMYAAAGAAAVMMQGVDNVKTHITGLYTATEALGPMFNTTAGDMLGLGHSLQTAQNMANPGVYELLGEAITGIKNATGPTTNGLSAFGQMGLDVEHILDAFAAKLDIDIVQNMGKIHSVLANAVQDLTEFGQILGNVGHALLNLAADMPGAAEIALKVVDMFSQLLKWVSALPAPLIWVIMVFEEMYRWSGLVAGGFAILGRAIALVGTLGIPVLVKIGSNVGKMAASLIEGLAGMVVNFTAMGEKIGLFGAGVDKVATGIVGGLGKAAAFMTGPWGIALSLAAIGITALAIAFSRGAGSTEAWVTASQKAVTAANNLQVMNVIAQQMDVTTQHLAKSNNELATAQNNLINSSKQTDALSALAHSEMAVQNAINDQNNATKSQQDLMGQTANVLGGASAIANQFGVSFTTALGYADLAGVKLSTTTVKFGKDMNAAGLQIASLVSGYAAMDQVGNTLANSMAAVNVQAGLQATDVSKVNSAWDQFISNALGLTGGLSQLNLDLQQMGNQAAITGAKINAFTGTTTLSVNQIAQALTSFSGASAQTWQAFNQSVTQANTYMDALRTAAASGVVAQTQFQQAGSDVVAMLLPYASKSKTATAEVSMLAQEVGGPATTNFQTLKEWVDKTGGSSQNLTGLTETLTQKMTNLTQVAQNFAGTLKQDVINAIAAAGVSTSNITGLTEKYTQSLQDNGANSKTTKQYQDELTNALKGYGFTATDISQIEAQLTTNFGKNTDTISAGEAARARLQTDIQNLIARVPTAGQDIVNLASAVRNHGTTAAQMHGARQQLYNDLVAAGVSAGNAKNDVNNLITALRNIPANVSAKVSVTGSGGEHIVSSVGPGGTVTVYPVKAAAAGGVIPGYEPGHDSVLAYLSKGEGILIPQAVKALGGEKGINAINKQAQHFAWGGVTGLPNQLEDTAGNAYGAANAAVLAKVLASVNSQVTSKLNVQAAAALAASASGASLGGNVVSWIQAAMKDTGAPQSWMSYLLRLVSLESGGNPNAVDPISVMGEHASGLFQTLPSTYAQFATVGGGVFNPVADAVAGIRYIMATYGSPANIPGLMSGHYVGYDSGGLLMPGYTLAYNGTGQPETVTPGGAGDTHIHFEVGGKEIAHAIIPALNTLGYQKAARNRGNASSGQYFTPGSGRQGQ